MTDAAHKSCVPAGEHQWRTPGRCICDRCGFVDRTDPFDVDKHAWYDGVACRLCGFTWICSCWGHRWNNCVCQACGEGRSSEPFRREQHEWVLDRCYLCDARCEHQKKSRLEKCRVCGHDGPRISVRIPNRLGLHGRSAIQMHGLAIRFESQILVRFLDIPDVDPAEVHDVRNIAALLRVQAGPGARIHLEAVGTDAEEALHAFAGLIRSGFGEGIG